MRGGNPGDSTSNPLSVAESLGAALVVPGIGQVVNLEDERECALALSALRDFEQQVRDAKRALTEAIVERSRALGTKTIVLKDGVKVEVRGGSETRYDAEGIEHELRALGAPEEMIREIVTEEVTYKVDARRAKQAAAANDEYAAVIESNAIEYEKPYAVLVRRG